MEHRSGRRESNPHDQLGRLRLDPVRPALMQDSRRGAGRVSDRGYLSLTAPSGTYRARPSSLGYEPHDAGLRCLVCSPTCHLAWAVVLPASLQLDYVSGVPFDLPGSRAQIRAQLRRGVRSSPRRAPCGLPRVLRDGKGCPWGPIEVSPCRPGGSGARALPVRARRCPSSYPPSPREGRGAGQRLVRKPMVFTSDHDRCDCRTAVHLGKHDRLDSGLRVRPTYIPRRHPWTLRLAAATLCTCA